MAKFILNICDKCGREHKEPIPANPASIPQEWASATITVGPTFIGAIPYAPESKLWCKYCWQQIKREERLAIEPPRAI